MSTKTFKSTEGGFSIGIHPVTDGVQFRITNRRGNYQQFTTPASVAAEQALAILEAAGVPMQGDFNGPIEGTDVHLSFIAQHLERYVVESENITAEAEAQAKLEDEALQLFNARQEAINSVDWEPYKEFASEDSKQTWLAVARRAREINKEEK